MAGPSRYSIDKKGTGITKRGILKNKLGIPDQKRLDDTETILLSDAYAHFFDLLAQEKLEVGLSLLFDIHAYFLGPLYSWAGKIRTIDISKDNMLFAPVKHIDSALRHFDSEYKKNIPIPKDKKRIAAKKFAFIHAELNAIHPFREGNGRTIRLFLDLLAVNAGYHPIDWSKKSKKAYITACVQGMAQEYSGLERMIFAGLTKKKR